MTEMERCDVTEGRSKSITKNGNFIQGLKYGETLEYLVSSTKCWLL
jgi:hypothetical protein